VHERFFHWLGRVDKVDTLKSHENARYPYQSPR
jgi:hypothetical protein